MKTFLEDGFFDKDYNVIKDYNKKQKMENINHCRFENTTQDLQDCYDTIIEDNYTDLSDPEKKALLEMLELCSNIIDCEDDIKDKLNKPKVCYCGEEIPKSLNFCSKECNEHFCNEIT